VTAIAAVEKGVAAIARNAKSRVKIYYKKQRTAKGERKTASKGGQQGGDTWKV